MMLLLAYHISPNLNPFAFPPLRLVLAGQVIMSSSASVGPFPTTHPVEVGGGEPTPLRSPQWVNTRLVGTASTVLATLALLTQGKAGLFNARTPLFVAPVAFAYTRYFFHKISPPISGM